MELGLTLGVSAARLHLERLLPQSEEAKKLRSALMKTIGIVEISLPTGSYKVDTLNHSLLGGFGSSEHVAIGKEIKLEGLPDKAPLLMKGATAVYFSDIVALAGDFYGVVNEAICLGGEVSEKPARFKRAFDTLLLAPDHEVRRILLEIHQEYEAVSNSGLPRHCYSKQLFKKNRAIKKIKGDIDDLLVDNSDHFHVHAKEAYVVGHAYALELARTAGQNEDLDGLKRAYAIDAFACHFLTDLFSAGHIRNQRGLLEIFLVKIGFPPTQAKPLAGLLTAAQHEQDGHAGLNVRNEEGEQWRAYGDGSYWAAKNDKNKSQVIKATKHSVDEVFAAYQNPQTVVASVMDSWIPYATEYNSPPVYSMNLNGTSVILHQGSKELEIRTRKGFWRHAISHSMRYLPEDYVSTFIGNLVSIPPADFPILNKVIVPQIERLTGSVWHLLGLASYHQLKQQSGELNEKINEMADGLRVVTTQNSKILEKLRVIEARVNQQTEDLIMKDLRKAIVKIESAIYQIKAYLSTVNDERLSELQTQLRNGYILIGSILERGTLMSGERLLLAYKQLLKEQEGFIEEEAGYQTTIWFRRMLDYQIKAFKFYSMLAALRGGAHQIVQEVSIFEEQLVKQIEANSEYIYVDLVYESMDYIKYQLNNDRVKRKARKLFNSEENVKRDYARLAVPPITSTYCSQIHRERTSFRPPELDARVEVTFREILIKSVLCWHDVDDLNQIYSSVDQALRHQAKFSIKKSILLKNVIQRVELVLKKGPQSLNFDDILSVYHLRNFIEDIGIRGLKKDLKENAKAQLALKMPFCFSENQFKQDVNFLIGPKLNLRVSTLVDQKRDLLIQDEQRKREVENKKAEFIHLNLENPKTYPSYLGELLDFGFLSLYLHLISMRALPDREVRAGVCNHLSFSELSRIVLETRAAIIKRVKEAMPANWKDCEVIFLLGSSGAGKSTTLSFLRGDKMKANGDNYFSSSDSEGISGPNDDLSCTFLPVVETIIGKRVIVDFPGLEDSSGPFISVGIELALKSLITRYDPKVLVLESIINTEERCANVARLGARLSRLLANKQNCILGITKYLHKRDFTRLEEIEAKQRRQQQKQFAPSKEEVALQAEIALLETLVAQMPALGDQLAQKKAALAEIEAAKQSSFSASLPETDEKKGLRDALANTEQQLLQHTGLRHLVRFARLENEDSLTTCLQTLSGLDVEKVVVNPELSLDVTVEKLLETRFQQGLQEELESKKGYHLDFEDPKEFRQRVLDTSLINVITPWAPQIGQFLHLPEMDENLVRNYSQTIVENCIRNYIEGIVAELQLSTVEMLLKRFSYHEGAWKLGQEIERLKSYILGLKGLGHLLGEKAEEAKQEWQRLEVELKRAREAAGKSVEKSFQLGFWATLGLGLPIGIPLGVYKLVEYMKTEGARGRAENQLVKNLITSALKEVQGLFEQIVQLKEIEKIITKQKEIDTVFHSMELSIESKKTLMQSIETKIDRIKDLYGSTDWEARTAVLSRSVRGGNRKVCLITAALLLDDSLFVSGVGMDHGQRFGGLDPISISVFWEGITGISESLILRKGEIFLEPWNFFISDMLFIEFSRDFDLNMDLRSSLSRALLADVLMKQS